MATPKDLTPGVLDGTALRAFKHGDCDIFAVALHDKTGWPLVKVTDHHNVHDGRAHMGSAMHWMLRHPSGKLVDVDGLHEELDILDEYDGHADDEKAAIGWSTRQEALDEYEEKGGRIPLKLAKTFVDAVLAKIDHGRYQE